MRVFSIYDGRESFWQWDLNQKIVVANDVYTEIHFSNGLEDRALVCEVYTLNDERVVDVPNVLLQDATPLQLFVYIRDDKGDRTIISESFAVIPREKPDDYVYTETEARTWESLEKRVADLENGDVPIELSDEIILTDRTTSKRYALYIDNGKLFMEESEE